MLGNQLAVVTDASKLSTFQMQRIANEMHFSETTFVLSTQRRQGGYDIRNIYAFKGSAVCWTSNVLTVYIIRQFIAMEKSDKIVLNLKVGQISVDFKKNRKGDEIMWMTQPTLDLWKNFSCGTFRPDSWNQSHRH